MSRYNSVPVIVQQMVESIQSKSTPEHVKFNQAQVIETIRLLRYRAGKVE